MKRRLTEADWRHILDPGDFPGKRDGTRAGRRDGPRGGSAREAREPVRLSCDVCVIGSGAGGSVAAAELAAAGWWVLLVERGPCIDPSELDFNFLHCGTRLSRIHFTAGRRVSLNQGSVVGGGTAHFVGVAELPPHVALADWAERTGIPFDDGILERDLAATGRVMEATLQEESLANRNNALVAEMAEALGRTDGMRLKRRFTTGCAGAGLCVLGCAHDLKATMLNTYLADGLRSGNLTVLIETEVTGIEGIQGGDGGGTAAGGTGPPARATVVRGRMRGPDGDPERGRDVVIRPAAVVVAAGAVASSSLLLRCDFLPPLEWLGRDVHLQPHAQVYALFPEPVNDPPGLLPDGGVVRGGVPSVYNFDAFLESDRFAWHAASLLPPGFALYLRHFPPEQHALFMERFAQMATVNLTLRDLPARAEVDEHGTLHYRESDADRRHLRAGLLRAAEAYLKVGAEAVLLPFQEPVVVRSAADLDALEGRAERDWAWDRLMVFSDQLNGGNRMAVDRERGAVDPSSRVFGTANLYVADGSLFPDSLGVSPSWTIMSLARRVAAGIEADLRAAAWAAA